jgi:glycosyltransferase involved in cell wall biosynthesis
VAGTHPFNEAVSHARGTWIAPIDHDDEWEPDHLEVLVGAALRSRAELVYGVCRAQIANIGTRSSAGGRRSKGSSDSRARSTTQR